MIRLVNMWIFLAATMVVLNTTEIQARSLGGHCKDWMTTSLANETTGKHDAKATELACKALRKSGDFKTDYLDRSNICLICSIDDWVSYKTNPASDNPGFDGIVLPPLPDRVVAEPSQGDTCAKRGRPDRKDPIWIGILPIRSTCSKPWITKGKGKHKITGQWFRRCAYCGPDFTLDGVGCCVKKRKGR